MSPRQFSAVVWRPRKAFTTHIMSWVSCVSMKALKSSASSELPSVFDCFRSLDSSPWESQWVHSNSPLPPHGCTTVGCCLWRTFPLFRSPDLWRYRPLPLPSRNSGSSFTSSLRSTTTCMYSRALFRMKYLTSLWMASLSVSTQILSWPSTLLSAGAAAPIATTKPLLSVNRRSFARTNPTRTKSHRKCKLRDDMLILFLFGGGEWWPFEL